MLILYGQVQFTQSAGFEKEIKYLIISNMLTKCVKTSVIFKKNMFTKCILIKFINICKEIKCKQQQDVYTVPGYENSQYRTRLVHNYFYTMFFIFTKIKMCPQITI